MSKALVLAVVLACAGQANAATVCRILSGTGLAFGPYNVLSTSPTDTLTTVGVTCERNGGESDVTLVMRLGQGTHGSSVAARSMLNATRPGEYLAYNLFRDVSRNAVWGFSDGIDTMARSLSIPNRSSSTATFTIYGRIAAQQDVAAGNYTDSVQVTVTP